MAGKYNQLKRLSAHLPVPALTAVTEQDLASWWTNYSEILDVVGEIITSINLTSSAFLDEHLGELTACIRPQWSADSQASLLAKLGEVGLDFDEPLAVRSSGSVEDGNDHSYAGLFVTRLDARGCEAVKRAIEEVWASNFGRSVLIEQLRYGPLSGRSNMTVILQRMVPATWAGVAFSHDPVSGEQECIVEAVPGYGEALVSGEERGIRAQIDGDQITPTVDNPQLAALFLKVACLVSQVVAAQGGEPTDVEWAYDGHQLWLLQSRCITTVGKNLHDGMSICNLIPLYESVDSDIDLFKPLPDFAHYFRSKRKPMVDFSLSIGLQVPTSLLIRANRDGLNEAAEALMGYFKQPRLLLDLSSRVRQQELTQNQVIPRLRELLGTAPSVFVLRDFVRGEGGLITQVIQSAHGEPRVLCEWSQEGLLAINRGTASTMTFMVDAEGEIDAVVGIDKPPSITRDQRILLYKASTKAQVEFGRVQLEWVSDRGQLYIIDYSRLDSISALSNSKGARIISAGYADGFPVVVDASRGIEQLSIAACVSLTDIPTPQALGALITKIYEQIRAHDAPVIVVSPKPYAALAPLIPYAAGFLFEQASTLCHLAILLREHGIPAIESRQLYQDALTSDNQRLTVDSSLS